MKTLILSLFILSAIALPAQNYENICSPGITYYHDNAGNLKAFRRDSVNIPVSGDSIFISYRAIRDTSSVLHTCNDTTNGSVLGRKVYKKSSGWFYFFNRLGDTVKINSQAAVNTSWKFCLLPAGSYIQATVTSITTKQVLGINDLVKTITFQAKNSSNNNISHILNGTTIELSQHFGLSKMLDIFYVPENNSPYFLAGKSDPSLGVQNITVKDVFNIDVGDEFHYQTSIQYLPMGGYNEDKINIILGKTVFGNYDSVWFQVESCIRWTTWWPEDYGTSYDTILLSYNLIELSNMPVYLMMPDEFIRVTTGFFNDIILANSAFQNIASFNGRHTNGIQDNSYQFSSGCWTGGYDPPISNGIYEYSVGLGQTHYYYGGFEGPNIEESLVYFKKGIETWGTPVATDCNALVGFEDKTTPGELSIKISPNPFKYKAEILLVGLRNKDNLTLSINNIYGNEIFHGIINSNPFIFDRQGIPGGCYILTIRDNQENIKGRTKIIFE
jgi:hypothetical protein